MWAPMQVFTQTHIPRALEEVQDHEQDFDRLAKGTEVEGIYYQTITGMRQDMTGARLEPSALEVSHRTLHPDSTKSVLDCASFSRIQMPYN